MSRGILVFLFIMALETVHGILRSLFLVPRIGEKLSGLIGWPVAVVIVMVVSTLLIGWTRVTGTAALLRLGVVWAVLTFIFESAVGLLRGLDAAGIWAAINPFSGGSMLYSMLVMLLAPMLVARIASRHANT